MEITKLYYLYFNIIIEIKDESKNVKNMKMPNHLYTHEGKYNE